MMLVSCCFIVIVCCYNFCLFLLLLLVLCMLLSSQWRMFLSMERSVEVQATREDGENRTSCKRTEERRGKGEKERIMFDSVLDTKENF